MNKLLIATVAALTFIVLSLSSLYFPLVNNIREQRAYARRVIIEKTDVIFHSPIGSREYLAAESDRNFWYGWFSALSGVLNEPSASPHSAQQLNHLKQSLEQ